MKIALKFLMLFIVTLSLSLSYNSVSSREEILDLVGHERSDQESTSSDDVSPEIEFYETLPMIPAVAFKLSTKTISDPVAENSSSEFDSLVLPIDIPPLG